MSGPRVVVIGGGPAGAGVALTLAEAGVRALVIDRATRLRDKPGECLTSNFRPLLERLGLIELLDQHRRIPAFLSRWDHDLTHAHELITTAQGEGWLLDRRRFEAQLIGVASERGARWQLGWSLATVERREPMWTIELVRGTESRRVEVDFLVDATGRAAKLVRMLGEPRQALDRLFGSWLITRERGRGDGPVRIEADADGWWYATALPDGRCSLVYFSDRAQTDAVAMLAQARERELVGDLLRFASNDLPPPSVHPASSVRAARVCGPGWFAVGDAALAFDPLSSYGIGSALGTGHYAATALLRAWSGERAAGEDYQSLLDTRWSAYLVGLAERYGATHSWSNQRFWVERRPA